MREHAQELSQAGVTFTRALTQHRAQLTEWGQDTDASPTVPERPALTCADLDTQSTLWLSKPRRH